MSADRSDGPAASQTEGDVDISPPSAQAGGVRSSDAPTPLDADPSLGSSLPPMQGSGLASTQELFAPSVASRMASAAAADSASDRSLSTRDWEDGRGDFSGPSHPGFLLDPPPYLPINSPRHSSFKPNSDQLQHESAPWAAQEGTDGDGHSFGRTPSGSTLLALPRAAAADVIRAQSFHASHPRLLRPSASGRLLLPPMASTQDSDEHSSSPGVQGAPAPGSFGGGIVTNPALDRPLASPPALVSVSTLGRMPSQRPELRCPELHIVTALQAAPPPAVGSPHRPASATWQRPSSADAARTALQLLQLQQQGAVSASQKLIGHMAVPAPLPYPSLLSHHGAPRASVPNRRTADVLPSPTPGVLIPQLPASTVAMSREKDDRLRIPNLGGSGRGGGGAPWDESDAGRRARVLAEAEELLAASRDPGDHNFVVNPRWDAHGAGGSIGGPLLHPLRSVIGQVSGRQSDRLHEL